MAASGDDEEENSWQYLAHYRSHYKQITGIYHPCYFIIISCWYYCTVCNRDLIWKTHRHRSTTSPISWNWPNAGMFGHGGYSKIFLACFTEGKKNWWNSCTCLFYGSMFLLFPQVEYDLANSSIDNLKLAASDRIEQSAIPTAMIWYPPITKESFLLITNNQVYVMA